MVTFTATDDSGNVTTDTATVTVTDLTAPTITVPGDITVEGDTAGGADPAGTALAAFLSAATATDLVDSDVAITTDAPTLFPVGDTVVTFTATDDAGNTATDTATVTVTDLTAPTTTVPADITVEGDTTGGADPAGTALAAFLAGATATDIVDSDVTITTDAPTVFPVGATVVTFTATDDAGNTATDTATVTVTDTTAPTITAPDDISVEGDTAGGADPAGTALAALLAGAVVSDVVDSSVTVTTNAPALFPVGATVVTFTATDDAGNTATDTATVTVTDTTAPTITAPDDISVEGDTAGGADPAGTALAALLAGAVVSDVVDSSVTVTTNAPALFPVGATVVTFTATDDAGNTATDTATVTVTDTTAPTITAPDDISVEGDTAGGADPAGTALAALLAGAVVSDVVDSSVTVTTNAPALFPVGATVVTFTATDDAGNTATDTATVTVTDTTAPTITAPDDISVEGDTTGGADPAGTALADFLASAVVSDLVDSSVTVTTNAPALFPVGATVVTFTATDDAGNVSTDTATVTVTDTTAPTISAIADQTVDAGTATSALDFTVSDIVTPAGMLTVTATSSDQTLVPDANIQLGGTDGNRTVTVTPAADQAGTATITVSVTDEAGLTASEDFQLTVNLVGDPVITISPTGPGGDPDPLPGTSGQPTSWATQRSSLRQITVDLPISPATVSAGDIVLTNLGVDARAGGDADQVIDTIRDDQLVLVGNQLTINLDANQLPDGVYQLELKSTLTGGASFTLVGSKDNGLFVLTGDWNGSGAVTVLDFATFSYWFSRSTNTNTDVPADERLAPEYVDLNDSGAVTVLDFAGFSNNFSKVLRFPGDPAGVTAAATTVDGESLLASLASPADVNGDGVLTGSDALRVINALEDSSEGEAGSSQLDVNGDGKVTGSDALFVINRLAQDVWATSNGESSEDGDGDTDVIDQVLADGDLLNGLF